MEREFRGHRNFLSLHITLLKNQAEGFPSLHSHFLLISPHDFDPKHLFKKKTRKSLHAKICLLVHFSFLARQFSLERVAYMLGPQAWSVQSFPVAKALSLSRGRFSPFDMSFASFALGTSNLAEFGMGRLGKTNGGSFLWETWHVNKKTELTTYEECLTSANGTQSYQSARRQS